MEQSISKILQDYLKRVTQSDNLPELDKIYLELFGKSGSMTLMPKQFAKLKQHQLVTIGPIFNQAKLKLDQAIAQKRAQVKEQSYKKLPSEKLDIRHPQPVGKRQGHMHLLSQFENEIVALFGKLGFQRFDAPLIDTDYNNFEVLNIPSEHPARDLWDTLYIDSKPYGIEPGKLLLRTHTSNSQIHIMKSLKPPIRMMNIGSCFRYENLDARHEHTFEQFELIYIDKGLSMANLQYLSEYFLKSVFGEDIAVRLKPKYYPFVEPGAGVDALCVFCQGKGCKICGGVGWLELAGAGMIHPNVLKNGGIDPNIYSGIAWGLGPGRMLMVKYGINDLRVHKSADLKFLEKY